MVPRLQTTSNLSWEDYKIRYQSSCLTNPKKRQSSYQRVQEVFNVAMKKSSF
jgi:hypothetical protein